MSLIKTIVFSLILLFGSNIITNGQSTAQSLVDKFFNDFETKGAKVAIDELYKTNKWTSRIQDNVNEIKNQLAGFDDELVGKYYGHVSLDKIETTDCFSIQTYLMKFDRQPLRLTFKLYKPNDKWILYAFSFDDTFDEDLEKALNWRYSFQEK